MTDLDFDQTVASAKASIKKGSKSFALASLIFSPDMRDDVSMLYAWCRHCDDVIDGQIMGHGQAADYRDGQAERLDRLRRDTHDALARKSHENPVFSGLAHVFGKYDIPHRHADELLRGFEMDAAQRRYLSLPDTLDYCYHVAGVVGVMMAYIMGVRDPAVLDRASDLGLAFQLTNISRDVIDDAAAGRVYLPEDLLSKAGAPLRAEEIEKRENWPAAYEAVLPLLDQAEAYYRSAKVGIRHLPFRCAWAILAALRVYREIGEKLRNEGPEAWASRIYCSKGRKTWLAVSSGGPAILRAGAPQTPRTGLYQRPSA